MMVAVALSGRVEDEKLSGGGAEDEMLSGGGAENEMLSGGSAIVDVSFRAPVDVADVAVLWITVGIPVVELVAANCT